MHACRQARAQASRAADAGAGARAVQGDIPASQMLNSLPGVDPARRAKLVDVLDIDPTWRMHLVSDGQRRRVQIAMGLLKPFQVSQGDERQTGARKRGRMPLWDCLRCGQAHTSRLD